METKSQNTKNEDGIHSSQLRAEQKVEATNLKKRIFLKEWTPTEVELSKEEIEQILSICLQKIGKLIIIFETNNELGIGKPAKNKVKDRQQKLISISPTTKVF
jgi:hypothetical protein